MSLLSSGERPAYLPEPLSMTNEERDIVAFQEYLRTLSPEALWDIHAHLNSDRYPRRYEAVQREMSRCRLLYFPLYNEIESRLRHLFFAAVIFAAFAAGIHLIPEAIAGMARASQELGGDNGGASAYGQALRQATQIYDLSTREVETLNALTRLFRGLTEICLLATALALPVAAYRAFRRRLRPDVVITGIIAALIATLLLRF